MRARLAAAVLAAALLLPGLAGAETGGSRNTIPTTIEEIPANFYDASTTFRENEGDAMPVPSTTPNPAQTGRAGGSHNALVTDLWLLILALTGLCAMAGVTIAGLEWRDRRETVKHW